MRLSPALFVALLALVTAPAFARPAVDPVPASPGRAPVGSFPACGSEVVVYDNAFLRTPYSPDPAQLYAALTGLWIGAKADLGQGPETHVSTSAFPIELWSPDNPPPPGPLAAPRPEDLLVDGFRIAAVDTFTSSILPDHVPIGIRVDQEVIPAQTVGDLAWLDVKCTVTNISDEYSFPGWDLVDLYFGVMMDPDVGMVDQPNQYLDDLGAFEPAATGPDASQAPGAARGGLAYAWDTPGTGDDVDVQIGLVIRRDPVHAFRVWSFPGDATGDAGRYARMRGASDTDPTIDPPATVPNDYRILLSVGPVTLAPGQSRTYAYSVVCGELVPDPPAPQPVRVVSRAPDLVVSRSAAPGVRFPADAGSVEVFSVTGRRVAKVPATTGWDLRTPTGLAPAGVYFYRAESEPGVRGKVVVTR